MSPELLSLTAHTQSSSSSSESSHASDEESEEFEHLESLIEDAHHSDSFVRIEDHDIQLLNDVIPHVASDLQVDQAELLQRIVPPAGTPSVLTLVSDNDEPAIQKSSSSTVSSAVEDESSEDLPASPSTFALPVLTSGSSAVTSPDVAEDSIPMPEGEQLPDAGFDASGNVAKSDRSVATAQSDVGSPQVAASTNQQFDAESRDALQDVREADVFDGTSIATEAAIAETFAQPEMQISVSMLGIRFGSGLSLFERDIRLPLSEGDPITLAEPASSHASIAPESSGLVWAAVAAAAASSLWSSRPPETKVILKKIARRIRRSVRF
ncbi:MAG: hypothetical protein R3C49_10390 [Planctomycetaceae bacterium]